MLGAAQYSKKGVVDCEESDWFVAVIIEFGLDFSAAVVEMDVSIHKSNDNQLFHCHIVFERVMVEVADQPAFQQLNLADQLTVLIDVYCRKVGGPGSDKIVVGQQVPEILIRRTIAHHLSIAYFQIDAFHHSVGTHEVDSRAVGCC